MEILKKPKINKNVLIGILFMLFVGIVFWILAQKYYFHDLNYTLTIATSFLKGSLGTYEPYSWLNELVPGKNGIYYSVFPLGAVFSMLPFSLITKVGLFESYPVALIVAFIAMSIAGLSFAYTFVNKDIKIEKRIILVLWLIFGTWFMTNLLFAGSWHLALGFAVLGELGALYWSIVKPKPILAGLFLAIAFGNRTEIVLITPIILFFLLRPYWPKKQNLHLIFKTLLSNWKILIKFLAFPTALILITAIYNLLRFGSATDFGYSHIPGVLNEYEYRDGIFSLSYIANNAHQMLWQGWVSISSFPYWRPTGFGGSIILASPFLLLLIRKPRGDIISVTLAWIAIVLLTLALWVHGNPGGWQYSYRYASILLPWFLVLFVEYLPKKVALIEIFLLIISIASSIYATYLFMYSSYMSF